MIRIAVVEDESGEATNLKNFIDDYFNENNREKAVEVFNNALQFLNEYKPDYDIVFMDIEMPALDGMAAAEKLRKIDSRVILIFVTNMQQYAVKGYAVDALDFVIKPIKRNAFFALMDKALRIIKSNAVPDFTVRTTGGIKRICVQAVHYVEVQKHKIIIHTEDENIEVWGSMGEMEKQLPPESFSRCNVCYLVNLRHVTAALGDEVKVGDETLKISRPRKKQFLADLAAYLGSAK